jgi:hypothetical protein
VAGLGSEADPDQAQGDSEEGQGEMGSLTDTSRQLGFFEIVPKIKNNLDRSCRVEVLIVAVQIVLQLLAIPD